MPLLRTSNPIKDGYYYDMFLEGRQVSSTDFDQLDTLFKGIVKENHVPHSPYLLHVHCSRCSRCANVWVRVRVRCAWWRVRVRVSDAACNGHEVGMGSEVSGRW